jgi:hypothetical protein
MKKVYFLMLMGALLVFTTYASYADEKPLSADQDSLQNSFEWDVVFSVDEIALDYMYTPAETSGASYHCTPSDPEPAHESENVEYENVTLSWDCTDGTKTGVTYNVYLGTDERILPRVSDNQISELSITIDRLLPSTKYYWTVVSVYGGQANQVEGRWTFTTKKGKLPPYIKLAGFGVTNITNANGGTLSIYALCEDQDGTVDHVDIYLGGQDTGADLADKNKDGVWDFVLPNVPSGLGKGAEFVFELVAVDNEGNESDMWPYLTVHSELPKFPAKTESVIPWLDKKLNNSEFNEPYKFTLTKSMADTMVRKAIAAYPQNPLDVPAILVGGYWNTFLEATSEEEFTMLNITAIIWEAGSDIDTVEVFENMDTGSPFMDYESNAVVLNDSGSSGDQKAGDGWWTYMNVTQSDAGIIELGIVATDDNNKKSDMWPKVVIH